MALFSGLMIALVYVDAKVFSFLFYLLIASLLLILFIIFGDKTLSILEKKKIGVLFIVSFFVIFFWSAFEQGGASLTFFADEQTDRYVGLHIPVWIVYILSISLLAFTYKLYKKAALNLSANDVKLRNTVYFLLATMGLGILYINYSLLTKGNQDILFEEVPASFFQSLNSLFVVSFAPVFAWIWLKLGKYEPSSPTKMALGLLFLALGYLWIATGVKDVQPGIKVGMIWLTGLYILHTWGELCLSPIGMSLFNKLSPLKLSSLLMAVWFLANAFANKLAGKLSALYPDQGTSTSFMGFEMHNMYDFFLLFVILAGIASLILFSLTSWLQKMMKP
jgi:POT family proton-dependent oligopeptide transporter